MQQSAPVRLAFVPIEQIQKERRLKPTNIFHFGNQKVTTRVFMMVPETVDAIALDVVDYIWEKDDYNETTD